MCRFDEEMKPYYERYDKAMEANDINEIAYFSKFTLEKDIRKWWRRQVCENMHSFDKFKEYGYTEIQLNDVGWFEWKFPEYETKQEFVPLGEEINRGCCNMKSPKALAVMQVANGNWISEVSDDFTRIDYPFIYLGIHSTQYTTRTEAWNTALKKYIEGWKYRNSNVKKEDDAVKKARSLIIVQHSLFNEPIAPMGKVTAVQLELF